MDECPSFHHYKGEFMKKLLFLALLMVICLPLAAVAQEEAPIVEISGGYSFLRLDGGDAPDGVTSDSLKMNGFHTSVAGNLTRRIGIVGEFNRFTKSASASNLLGAIPIDVPVDLSQIDVKLRVQTFLFGPRVTLYRGKAEPFVHALFGGARISAEASVLGISREDSASAFAYALGGGLDIKVHKNLAIRVAQLDYLGARNEGENLSNFRYSAGIVIRLGKR
jgi:opacity protein-like surface antigen